MRIIRKNTGNPEKGRFLKKSPQHISRKPVCFINQDHSISGKVHGPAAQACHHPGIRPRQDPHLVKTPVNQAMPFLELSPVQEKHLPPAGKFSGKVKQQQSLSGSGISGQRDHRYFRCMQKGIRILLCPGIRMGMVFPALAPAAQKFQDLPPEFRLLIGQEISAGQILLR